LNIISDGGILVKTVGYCTSLLMFGTFCATLSSVAKGSIKFYSKFAQNGQQVGLRQK
jgi:hypothetical protein